MEKPYNPLAGTPLSNTWYLKRRIPGGRVAHYIDPVGLGALCPFEARKDWQYVPEDSSIKMCSKCQGVELQASVAQEIDNERLQ